MTRKKPNNDEVESSYQLPDGISRRNLLRGAGATAGVAAAGAIPTATNIEYPVGRADALGALTAGIAIGAGISGLTIAASWYLNNSGDPKDEAVKEVQEEAGNDSIYFAAESAILGQETLMSQLVDKYGVDASGSWVNQNSNTHRANIIDHAKGETALAWADGKSRSNAIKAGRDGARAVSYSSEITLHEAWNSTIIKFAKALDRQAAQYNYYIKGSDALYMKNSFSHKRGISAAAYADSDIDAYTNKLKEINGTDVTPSNGWFGPDSHLSVIQSYNYKSELSYVDQVLSDEQKPDNYDSMLLTAFGKSAGGTLYGIMSIFQNKGKFGAPYGYTSSETLSQATEEVDPLYKLVASHDGSKATLDVSPYTKAFDAVRQMRSNVVNNIDTFCGTVYDGLESGSIKLTDVLSARQLYQDLQPSEKVSMRAVTLASAGLTGGLDNLIKISTSAGKTYTGYLFIDSDKTINISVGTTINSGDYNRMNIIGEDASMEVISGVDVTIEEINGSTSGGEEITYEPREIIENPDTVTEEEIRKIIKDDRERFQDLKDKIKELEQDDPLGIGFGSGNDSLLIAGAAILGAYLLGR